MSNAHLPDTASPEHPEPGSAIGAIPNREECWSTRAVSDITYLIPSWIQSPSAWIEHIPFAFWLTEAIRPRTFVELGTHTGVSYMAFCQAAKVLALPTRCFAIDTWVGDEQAGVYGEEVYASISKHNEQNYASFSKLIRGTFDEAVSQFADGSIDLLHIDGLHTYEAVKHDFLMWLPKLSSRGVVLFHDTQVKDRWFGVFRLWNEITTGRPHFEFEHCSGLGVLGVGNDLPQAVRFLFDATSDAVEANAIRTLYAAVGGELQMAFLRQFVAFHRPWNPVSFALNRYALLASETKLEQVIQRGEMLYTQHKKKSGQPAPVGNDCPPRPQTYLQLFCDAGQGYSELSSVIEPLVPNAWQTIRIPRLQELSKRGRLRLDPVNKPAVIRISGIKIVSDTHGVLFKVETAAEFEALNTGSKVYLRMDGTEAVLIASGVDPQLFIPPMDFSRWGECSLEVSLKIDPDTRVVLRSLREMLDNDRAEIERLKAGEARLNAKGWRLQADAEYLRSELRAIRDSVWQLQEDNERLERVVDSAQQWQKRSWFKRAFHRWRFPGDAPSQDDSGHGFFSRLKRSIRKRIARGSVRPPAGSKPKEKTRKSGAAKQKLRSPVRIGPSSRLVSGGGFLDLSDPPMQPLSVTVIVPNFNHAPYLRQRLDSIYQQTFRKFDVLLMDDCSSDGSLEILKEYQSKYSDITQLIVNEANGGSSFAQWRKGLKHAKGELIWIAESDDWCDANFLETLTPYFGDEALMLAYCKTTFVDDVGAPLPFTFERYTKAVSSTKWNEDYVQTAHTEVSQALGMLNTIPNASSVVFRKPTRMDLLEDKSWLEMKICGDWVFYLHLIRGGKLGFSRKTNNYYRYHSQNTSTVRNHREFYYYKEHETVAKTVARFYAVEPNVLEMFRTSIADHFHHIFKNEQKPDWTFNDAFNMAAVLDERHRRLPNVMVVSHDFCTGGGEIAAIRLATAFHQEGYAVTFFNFNAHLSMPQFRRLLPPEIPVIQRKSRFLNVSSLIAGFGIEVINTHHGSSDRFFADLCREIRQSDDPLLVPKLVVTMHGMYESNPATLEKNGDTLQRNVDHWIYVADKNVAPFKARGWFSSEKFTKTWAPAMVPLNGCPKTASVGRETLGIPEKAFVICVASRAIEGKGWTESIKIVEVARARCGKDVHLLLLGLGPVADSLSATVLPPHVHLLGFHSNITDYYALADMGLLATTYAGESAPLTIIECLEMGKPFIATDFGEIRRMLLDESGELAGEVFAAPDGKIPIETVADIVSFYAANPEEYAKAAKRAVNAGAKFDIGKTVQIFKEVFASVLA